MPDPEEIRYPCVGCGTVNPAGVEICAGCGHRFAGPEGGPVTESITTMANRLAGPDLAPPPRRRPSSESTLLGCLGRMIAACLMGVAVIVAFAIAFTTTCSALWGNDSALGIGFIAGLAAAGLTIALFVWIGSKINPRE